MQAIAVLFVAFLLSGCASLSRADVCLRKKLEIEIPLDSGKFTPKPCKSKEVLTRIFS